MRHFYTLAVICLLLVASSCVPRSATSFTPSKLIVLNLENDADQRETLEYATMLRQLDRYTVEVGTISPPAAPLSEWEDEDYAKLAAKGRRRGAEIVTFGRVTNGKGYVGFLPTTGSVKADAAFHIISIHVVENAPSLALNTILDDLESDQNAWEFKENRREIAEKEAFTVLLVDISDGDKETEAVAAHFRQLKSINLTRLTDESSAELMHLWDTSQYEELATRADQILFENNAHVIVFGEMHLGNLILGVRGLRSEKSSGPGVVKAAIYYPFLENSNETLSKETGNALLSHIDRNLTVYKEPADSVSFINRISLLVDHGMTDGLITRVTQPTVYANKGYAMLTFGLDQHDNYYLTAAGDAYALAGTLWAETGYTAGQLHALRNEAFALQQAGMNKNDVLALKRSAETYRQYFNQVKRETDRVQIDMARYGMTLGVLGQFTKSVPTLEKSIEWSKKAIGKRNIHQAMLRNNLGLSYYYYHMYSGDSEAIRKSVTEFDQSLRLVDKNQDEDLWGRSTLFKARSMVNLGHADSDISYFDEAITGFNASLTVFDISTTPTKWGWAQEGIGNALVGKGVTAKSSLMITKAFEYYSRAEAVFDPQQTPGEWFKLKSHMTEAYLALASLHDKEQNIRMVIEQRNEIATTFSPKRYPEYWGTAISRKVLLETLLALGRKDMRTIAEASKEMDKVLDVCTRQSMPHVWAEATVTRAFLYSSIGMETHRIDLLQAAISENNKAMDFYVRQKNLSKIQELEKNNASLEDAIELFTPRDNERLTPPVL